MWIKVSVNPPNEGDVVVVKMDDGTPEMNCYAVAKYNPDVPVGVDWFLPVNCHSFYNPDDIPKLDYPVVAWKRIED